LTINTCDLLAITVQAAWLLLIVLMILVTDQL